MSNAGALANLFNFNRIWAICINLEVIITEFDLEEGVKHLGGRSSPVMSVHFTKKLLPKDPRLGFVIKWV